MTTRAITVRLTKAEYQGLAAAMVALDMEMEPLEDYEYRGRLRRTHEAAGRAWNKIKAARDGTQ